MILVEIYMSGCWELKIKTNRSVVAQGCAHRPVITAPSHTDS